MAAKRPLRTFISTATCSLRAAQPSKPSLVRTSACAFSTTTPTRGPEYDTETAERPRWQQTPARMVAPVRTRPLPRGPVFRVNEDPRRLDDAYVKMLGPGGDKVLTDEVKWLAVTHKSFDHGRRGFNDRLAFLGRRIVSLQTSHALLSSQHVQPQPDEYGRTPYLHPALNGLPGLSHEAKDAVLDKAQLSTIAERYNLDRVTRWKPKRADNLKGSGVDAVLATSLYAIIGAIALERGGDIANKVTQERILSPLGFTLSSEYSPGV
ncbi:ribonuclease-III-like-domain-containing protein [Massariosphaeria phaeospora]|uniref:Ribonuclease-III-like-domain-containing protein n=1 Tax=Massariosphaeria phaeospora TaxID=100035 RepID=A0A7C8M7R6_9PLEO|nr:ribonuclease-III-like-domain-containing protein [Massariosphaeria phaeospora]